MMQQNEIKAIDIFAHILPTGYRERLDKKSRNVTFYSKINAQFHELSDLDARFKTMDTHPGIKQVLTIASPPIEEVVTDGETAKDLSRMANDQLAELVGKYPDRFAAGVASLPMNDIDAALLEMDRAITALKFKGVQVYTPCNGKALDNPDFFQLYERMCEYDLPIWIHPARDRSVPDYEGEVHSRYGLFMLVGWPYETTMAMCRLVFSGVLERFSKIRFIAHHCGAMVPFFATRIGAQRRKWLPKDPIEYLHMFYCDTATLPSQATMACTHAFFGTDHMLFGTDMPYARPNIVAETLACIEALDVSDVEKGMISKENARALLNL